MHELLVGGDGEIIWGRLSIPVILSDLSGEEVNAFDSSCSTT